jgi:hypothetical protein
MLEISSFTATNALEQTCQKLVACDLYEAEPLMMAQYKRRNTSGETVF